MPVMAVDDWRCQCLTSIEGCDLGWRMLMAYDYDDGDGGGTDGASLGREHRFRV